jgi:4-alpha-glucanotransferase
MNSLHDRAVALGIATEYRDAQGRSRIVDDDTLGPLIDALSAADPDSGLLQRTAVIRRNRDSRLPVDAPPGTPVQWEILAETPLAQGEADAPSILLPADLPIGNFRLRLRVRLPEGERQQERTLLVAPEQSYQADNKAPQRLWGLAVQLYGVRSGRNWGHGDFSDLLALVDLAAECGAAAIGLNPLHALFDDRPEEASPYSPNSRLFFNPLYIDIDAIPEFPGLAAAGLDREVEQLRRGDFVDYRGVAQVKTRALQLAYEAFCKNAAPERQRQFQAFRDERGPVLRRYACFELLRRRFARPWREWPAQWRDMDNDAMISLREASAHEIGFFEFVQWAAQSQLAACRGRVREQALPIGLYLDIAVGVHPDGFDAWSERGAILTDVSIGAPPDLLNTAGQDWGLAGVNPVALEQRQFEPYRQMLQASMRFAGAIRLDHVLGLKRLFLVPRGMRPDQGSYVEFPFDALLAVTAQESWHHECIVIGEDLGTVPENFRETLTDWGIWSYRVMMFDRDGNGAFLRPQAYPEKALATFATHDLPTFVGWTSGRDLAVKRELSIDPGESDAERENALRALSVALGRSDADFDFSAVAEFLAAAPSRLLVVTMEDALEIAEQPNLPGTVGEYPNWRRRLPIALENLNGNPKLRAVAEAMAAGGRSIRRH